MNVTAQAKYNVPVFVSDDLHHNAQVSKAIEKARKTIERIPSENIKSWIMANIEIVFH